MYPLDTKHFGCRIALFFRHFKHSPLLLHLIILNLDTDTSTDSHGLDCAWHHQHSSIAVCANISSDRSSGKRQPLILATLAYGGKGSFDP